MLGFSFIHAADLHLDSPFVGITACGEIARTLRGSTFAAFDMLVATCIERHVAFLLLAGDVYDSRDRSLRAQLALRDGLAKLAAAGIHTYMVHGNHDPLQSRLAALEWPPEVHVFGADKVQSLAVNAGGRILATIHGISYGRAEEQRNLAAMFSQLARGEGVNIGLLHCNAGSNTGHAPYAPCDLRDLRDADMDYWALGHVHEHRILEQTPLVIYPGNIQGRSIRETGARGCCLVEVSGEGDLRPEFIRLDRVCWDHGTVSITGVESVDQLLQEMNAKVGMILERAGDRPVVCRLRVEGRGDLFQELAHSQGVRTILETVRENWDTHDPFVWVQSLEIRCCPDIDLDQRQEANDLLGEVLRVARGLREDDACARELADNVFNELFGSAKVKRAGLSPPLPDEIKTMLDAARIEAVNLLE